MRIIYLLIVWLGWSSGVMANTPPGACTLDNTAYQPGEKMVFTFNYNWKALWLKAGEMTFRVRESSLSGNPAYHLHVEGVTYRSYEWFYKVHDIYESYIQPESMLPMRFQRDVYEGGFIIKDRYDFSEARDLVFTDDQKNNQLDTFAIHACVHDVVSAIYYARNIDYAAYQPGDKIPIDVFIDRKVYHLYIRYMGKTTIKTRLGTFRVLELRPLLLDNEYFDGGEEMILYVTDDANKIPVRVESPLTVGSVKVDLIAYGGIRHPFAARLP
jgi:hypothetical protein